MDNNLSKILPLLAIFALFAAPAYAATGNVDTLCESISDDANVAGGCVDDDGLEDTITTAGALVVLEGGDKAGIIAIGFVAIVFLVVAGYAAGTFFGIWGKTKKMGN